MPTLGKKMTNSYYFVYVCIVYLKLYFYFSQAVQTTTDVKINEFCEKTDSSVVTVPVNKLPLCQQATSIDAADSQVCLKNIFVAIYHIISFNTKQAV